MIKVMVVAALVGLAYVIQAEELRPDKVELYCHRTANKDVPENTLESLEQAALLGCDVVEIDLRKTADGQIVLNHDGILEHLTDGVGEAETSFINDLQSRDAGSWMGERFAGMRITTFEEGLRLARKMDIRLILDMKTKGIGSDVLQLLQREGMLERVEFGGEWDDVKRLYPGANGHAPVQWVMPGVSAEQVRSYHAQGKAVIANFSANPHEMDLASMKAAVAAGVDAINVDYPRMGADAVGNPVEKRLADLIEKARVGDRQQRITAIGKLSKYEGFPVLQGVMVKLLNDADPMVSRAATVALVEARPRTSVVVLQEVLRRTDGDKPSIGRANTVWAMGRLGVPTDVLIPLLKDGDPDVVQAALLGLVRAKGEVKAETLLPLLRKGPLKLQGAAAMALAAHQPEVALKAVPEQLLLVMKDERVLYDEHMKHPSTFTREELKAIPESFKCQMKMVQAIEMLRGPEATKELEAQAFRPGEDFSQLNSVVAAFALWDRIGADAGAAVTALGSQDVGVAGRAEWMLVKASDEVLPEVRKALGSENGAVRERAIRIVAWKGDTGALGPLRVIEQRGGEQGMQAAWAIGKIEMMHKARE